VNTPRVESPHAAPARAPGPAPAPSTAAADARLTTAWTVLASVEDPEIPALSIVDLGLIRFIKLQSRGALEVHGTLEVHGALDVHGTLEVGLSPTYVGCPATEVIRRSVERALSGADLGEFVVTEVLSPAWSSDWITPEGRRKLELYGIVPPERSTASMRDILRNNRPVGCPRCRSTDTECISEFGSTPCKALHRCRNCLEPFEYFKCI
jgi:ring-1,2-phenylacetyl-CoA epoxidase subunit PaaD